MSTVLARAPLALVRQARQAQLLTITWMVIEGAVALAAAVAARSVALSAFGFDSAIEVFTAVVVLNQLSRPADISSEALDAGARRASRLVGIGLYTLAAYIVVSSAWTLLTGTHPDPSLPGLVLAASSVVIMPVLWRWRLGLSARLHSAALRADAACSAVCLYMAVTLLVGLALNRVFGWWWADPVAGLAMIWWIRSEAEEALEAARTGRHCEEC
jgi:divalent metal cation (Fe/Co/Zn/Cd) transporter